MLCGQTTAYILYGKGKLFPIYKTSKYCYNNIANKIKNIRKSSMSKIREICKTVKLCR